MSPELTVLTLAALLQVVQFAAFSVAANLEIGAKTAMGPRDTPVHLTGIAGRLQRAMKNHFEGLILFTIACVVITFSEQSNSLTHTCAWLYLAARIAYVPAYAFGLAPWRSLIWMIGFGTTTVMLITALF
ncbi:MAG: MAPEG family protein [Roseobacter sp.]